LIDTLLYDLLDIEPTADASEIKRAHRAAAKRFHPDRGGDEARFVAAMRAYSVLSDPQKRRRYDETGLYDAAEADSARADLIVTLSGALNHVLSRTALPVDSTDVVAEMRRLIEAGREVAAEELTNLDARLAALRAARKRVRSRDGRENLFLLVIDGQIRRLAHLQTQKRTVLESQRHALDELERCDSVVEMVRSVQPGLAPDLAEE
jgi:curved DNA-binding protein CbpA